MPHNRADLVCTRAARLFPTFPRWQRKVAEGFFWSAPSCWRPPALRQKNSFWPNWPPEPLAVTFPFSFHLSSDLFITVWTLELFDYEAWPYSFGFCSVLSLQTPSLFAAWFVFSSLLLQIAGLCWVSNRLVVTLVHRMFAFLYWFRALYPRASSGCACVKPPVRVSVCLIDQLIFDCFRSVIVRVFLVRFPSGLFASSLLAILACFAELRSHSSCIALFLVVVKTLVECFRNFVCFH